MDSRFQNGTLAGVKITPMREKLLDLGRIAPTHPPDFVFTPGKNEDLRVVETISFCGMDLACKKRLTERSFGAQNSRRGLTREVRWGAALEKFGLTLFAQASSLSQPALGTPAREWKTLGLTRGENW